MVEKKRIRGNPIPLIVEEHPSDYSGYPFITLIQYRENPILAIIDNANDKTVRAYVLDLCGPTQVDEELVIRVALNWFDEKRSVYPLSFEFSRLGLSNDVSAIYKTFSTEFITRIIGPLPRFEMDSVQSVKRRKRKPVPVGVDIKYNKLKV